MKISKFVFPGLVFLAAIARSGAEPVIKIVQPFENTELPPLSRSFVFGSVLPATASVTINGYPVTPHSNGGFLQIVPFQEGRFKIDAVASDGVSTATATRFVTVQQAWQSFPPNHPKIESTSPRTRVVLRPGDLLNVSFQGAPGGTAMFKIAGESHYLPMHESPGEVRGVYTGVYEIQPTDKFENDDIVFTLKRPDGDKIVAKSGAKITVQRRKLPRIMELKDDAVLLTGPGSDFGYHLFLPKGTRLQVIGEWGDFYKVSISDFNDGWIKSSVGTELPAGTTLPRSTVYNIRIDTGSASTLVEIPLKYRHPFRIEQEIDPHRLRLTLFGVTPDTDRIRYKTDKVVVKQTTWRQYEPGTYTLDILTKQKLAWGYDARYEGNRFILEIRHRPELTPEKRMPLKGFRVAVDAGHSKESFGTIGPLGNTEAHVNLMASNAVKEHMEKLGAEVVMIQDGTRELSLSDRVTRAWEARAHLFISVHADACDPGQDPREIQGFSVHYYQPQSRPFAESLHRIYRRNSGIPDQGLWRSNLAVCRATQMPSVLLEQAFLILPEYEEKMLTPAFQKMVAESISAAMSSLLSQDGR